MCICSWFFCLLKWRYAYCLYQKRLFIQDFLLTMTNICSSFLYPTADNLPFLCQWFYVAHLLLCCPLRYDVFPHPTHYNVSLHLICLHRHCHVSLRVSVYFFSHAGSVAPGMAMPVSRLINNFGPDWNVSTNIVWIAMKVAADIHNSQRICNNVGVSLPFHPVPSPEQNPLTSLSVSALCLVAIMSAR